MAKQKSIKSTRNNHKANQNNKNKGTSGSNKANSKVHGNRGKQKNPNNK